MHMPRLLSQDSSTPERPLFWSNYFGGIAQRHGEENSECGWVAFGGRCQWVLDATRQVVEWLCQPLPFESVVLRMASRLTWVCYDNPT